jgi:hypothetical protein
MKYGRVVIFGAGPAGMAIAHAADQRGYVPTIYSKAGGKSQMFGAQYLHKSIVGNCHPVNVSHHFQGTVDGYRRKVYGDSWGGIVSPQEFVGIQPAWDIRGEYDYLWDKYGERVVDFCARADLLEDIKPLLVNEYEYVFSTVPRNTICGKYSQHKFETQQIWAAGDAPELGRESPINCFDNTIICDGTSDTGWYRLARVFGHTTVEWPGGDGRSKPPVEGIARVTKPLWTDCDCHGYMHHMGRYGAWQKGILVHHVYEQALEVMGR